MYMSVRSARRENYAIDFYQICFEYTDLADIDK